MSGIPTLVLPPTLATSDGGPTGLLPHVTTAGSSVGSGRSNGRAGMPSDPMDSEAPSNLARRGG
ncbi:MAG: hypothetical protein EBY11_14745, partial [Proteobacteria bacterium]|nr:hypothetical protein [Pseudomonadota bacterium]